MYVWLEERVTLHLWVVLIWIVIFSYCIYFRHSLDLCSFWHQMIAMLPPSVKTTVYSRKDTSATRHRASTSMYSLTFRVRVTTPHSTVEMERLTQQVRRFYRQKGESLPACVVCVCGMRAAYSGPGGLLGSATHFHSVAIARQLVHRWQIRPILPN